MAYDLLAHGVLAYRPTSLLAYRPMAYPSWYTTESCASIGSSDLSFGSSTRLTIRPHIQHSARVRSSASPSWACMRGCSMYVHAFVSCLCTCVCTHVGWHGYFTLLRIAPVCAVVPSLWPMAHGPWPMAYGLRPTAYCTFLRIAPVCAVVNRRLAHATHTIDSRSVLPCHISQSQSHGGHPHPCPQAVARRP